MLHRHKENKDDNVNNESWYYQYTNVLSNCKYLFYKFGDQSCLMKNNQTMMLHLAILVQ
jgi:hypothetical protein